MSDRKKIIFSGVAPSGTIHIGNYLGAIKQWVELQNSSEYQTIFCVVDEHAITIPQYPKKLRQKIMEVSALYLAAGIDPKKSIIFIQSHVPEHTELAWILNTITPIGDLQRMTQFKDKSQKQKSVMAGLFNYPVLMAADILLYKTDIVPVGEDQLQHIELARTLAQKFNKTFGKTFIVPKGAIDKNAKRIMGLDNPIKKMSKSAENPNNYIALMDSPEIIRKKIGSAVTDSGKEISYDEKNKPGISNLISIYSSLSDKQIKDIEKMYKGKSYAEFKKDLSEVIISSLAPIREKYKELENNPEKLKEILKNGANQARQIASQTLSEAKQKIGFIEF